MQMDVAVCYGPRDVRVERQPVEPLTASGVLVRITYCGVCPWDLRAFSGQSSSVRYPLRMGHEISGVVERVGEDVQSLQPGDRVVVDAIRRCGTCPACRRGFENHCEQADYSRGGFAQYIVAPSANVYPLRETTSLLEATLTEPLACITRAQNRLGLKQGDTALVVGCGPLGLLHTQLLKQRGARVLVSDLLPRRLDMALTLGADIALNPSETDLANAVAAHTNGWGVEAAVVATGAIAAAQQALGLLALGGKLLLFAGVHPKTELAIDPNYIHYREIWLTGTSDYTSVEFRQALGLIEEGAVRIRPLISHTYPLHEIDSALKALQTANGLKLVVQCNAT